MAALIAPLTLTSCSDDFLDVTPPDKATLYNPQNEMLAFCKTKCSIRKTKRILLRIPS